MSCDACPRAVNGWFRGCLTASIVLDVVIFATLALIAPERSAKQIVDDTFAASLFVFPLTLLITCVLTGPPAAILVWLAERLRIRTIWFYAVSGVAVGALFCALLFREIGSLGAAFVLAGGPAGIVYWSVAGKYAGREE
ncbi:hypothetical protein [Bradyrhizobium sp. 930_D9_N1_4]|uniref:hypothetical protein n=1 Tax=Bradyrhizobium sp. 930_D9_N1_4 TaxID=3240374 RepID=UPI003F8BDB0B